MYLTKTFIFLRTGLYENFQVTILCMIFLCLILKKHSIFLICNLFSVFGVHENVFIPTPNHNILPQLQPHQSSQRPHQSSRQTPSTPSTSVFTSYVVEYPFIKLELFEL